MTMGLGDKVGRGQHVYAYINANSYPNNDAYSYLKHRPSIARPMPQLP